jgi:hypothetical protein
MSAAAGNAGTPTAPSAFPELEPLDEVSAILGAVGGALGVMARHLEGLENVGTDTPLNAYAISYAVAHAEAQLHTVHVALCDYARGLS